MQFSLIIPLWNEAKNISELTRMLIDSGLNEIGMGEVILVNNGSSDDTESVIKDCIHGHDWFTVHNLQENLNYGGGVYHGIINSKFDLVAYIPGDMQVSAKDLITVWNRYKVEEHQHGSSLFVKGHRTVREDPFQTQLVSHVYTFLANSVLGLRVKDVNGLPKLFDKKIIGHLPSPRAINFVFDTQLLLASRLQNWCIVEVPVTFHGRREGVSSWSGKRFQVYWTTFKQIISMRKFGK